jgi:protein gp37
MPLETWNPIIGCLHRCYNDGCWAFITAERLRHNPTIDRYREGFLRPKFIESD